MCQYGKYWYSYNKPQLGVVNGDHTGLLSPQPILMIVPEDSTHKELSDKLAMDPLSLAFQSGPDFTLPVTSALQAQTMFASADCIRSPVELVPLLQPGRAGRGGSTDQVE